MGREIQFTIWWLKPELSRSAENRKSLLDIIVMWEGNEEDIIGYKCCMSCLALLAADTNIDNMSKEFIPGIIADTKYYN